MTEKEAFVYRMFLVRTGQIIPMKPIKVKAFKKAKRTKSYKSIHNKIKRKLVIAHTLVRTSLQLGQSKTIKNNQIVNKPCQLAVR